MVIFRVETLGMERFERGFSRVESDIQDFSDPFTVILGDFRAMESRIFATEGTSEGEERFKELSDAYAAWKEERAPGRAVMTLWGGLRASLVGKAEGTVEEITKLEARFGTEVPGAHAHQVGYQKRNLPARRIVQVSEKAKRRWSRIVSRWAMGLFAKYDVIDYSSYLAVERWTAA